MIPSPRRTASTPVVPAWSDMDDDDGWQDMPVVRSDDNPFDLDEEDQKRYHYRPPARLDASGSSTPNVSDSTTKGAGNATGTHMQLDGDTLWTDSWREKVTQDESEYTRLRLDEDNESEEVHMRTKYLFNEDKAMTPLSQMQATKELLTEGQRIAYVGLCQLIARRMVRDMGRGWEGTKGKSRGAMGLGKGKGKGEVAVVESGNIWMLKIMARLYQHMELERDEQRMIESLAEHGVDPSDLVPALMTTHTVKNPEFDPQAKKEADLQAAADKEAEGDAEIRRQKKEADLDEEEVHEDESPPPPYEATAAAAAAPDPAQPAGSIASSSTSARKAINPFGEDEDDVEEESQAASSRSSSSTSSRLPALSFDAGEEDDGDIGSALSPHQPPDPSPPPRPSVAAEQAETSSHASEPQPDPEETPRAQTSQLPHTPQDTDDDLNTQTTLPSLPGVSTSLSNTDELVTLDIRWTVLCDLFLVLIADAVYDARSRVFLERVAAGLGFGWLDVVRFENRVTEALEIREGLEKTDQDAIIEGRRKQARNKRYAMMGLAAVGGGLVIGLSAGLMAPLIGAGLGTAFATVGITGTGTFLAGAGGAAVITTGGVLTGANIAGKGMARRTREVRTFEFRPLHNNKHVSCYITVGGFMASKFDDVRLPFSVLDPVVGDVFSVYWEPEMMAEMGSALKILTSEILTQVGQSVLQATVMAALMSALQWPIILTKLGYLIDNPWSNALDRARAAGLLLADTIIHRHAGVRPISLIGYSLGARAIFYALIELARVKAYGLVQDVFIFGTTVTASQSTWLDVRSVVSGRFVNGFATNDWMLGYLFRATSGGLNTVAGLRAVETVPGLENVDVTSIITGHMSYRSCMPQLLALVGFPVTADYFDEPDDPDTDMSVQERTIVNEAEEEAKQNRRKILGIFPVKQPDSKSRSSLSSSASGAATPVIIGDIAIKPAGATAGEYEYDGEEEDEEVLSPREEADLGTIPSSAHGEKTDGEIQGEAEEKEQAHAQAQAKAKAKAAKDEEEAVRTIPKTAGFDFQAISRELGKDIDVDKLRAPVAVAQGQQRLLDFSSSTAASASAFGGDIRAPLERSGSAPPPSASGAFSPTLPVPEQEESAAWSAAPSASPGPSARPPFTMNTTRSLSISRFNDNDNDDDGDITSNAVGVERLSLGPDVPAWDQGSSKSIQPSKSPLFSWNAWSSSSSSSASTGTATAATTATESKASASAPPMRAAPPARPHPPEFVSMNPFASADFASRSEWSAPPVPLAGGRLGAGAGGRLTRDEEEAETNPW